MMNCYEPKKASQQWNIDGTLLRWQGGPAGEWQIAGLKPPVGSQNVHLYVGPLDTLHDTQWIKEFVYIGM